MPESFALAIDLGGTNIKATAYSTQQGVLVRAKAPTLINEGPAKVLGRMAALALQVRALSEVPLKHYKALGVGSPGPLDPVRGVVLKTPNLKGWNKVPLAAVLSKAVGLPVKLENDARCAAWGEFTRGAGVGCADMAMLTLGTGVGGGLILDGKMRVGRDYTAGELGFLYSDPRGPLCNFGLPGSLEAFASATGLAKLAAKALAKRKRGPLWDLAQGQPSAVTAAMAHAALKQGDPSAREAWASAGYALGSGVAGLINALNLERVVIGGGVMAGGGKELLAIVRATAKRGSYPQPFKRCKIVAAALGNDAGAIGAAELALNEVQGRVARRES